MNPVKYYRDLLTDRPRIEAFQRAIQRVVRPGDEVLDLGTALGTFAFFAADAGAQRVWAVDGHPIVHVARAIAQINGYRGRVEFIRGWVPHVAVPGRADVVIFEDFPPRFMNRSVWQILQAVHRVYVKPGCRIIPRAARWSVAAVCSESLWAEMNGVDRDGRCYGVDWRPSRDYVMNDPLTVWLQPETLVTSPQQIGRIELGDPAAETGPTDDASWTLERAATVHGLAYWFDLEVDAEETLSNAPGSKPGSWRHLFLPLDPPLEVAAGTRLTARVRVPPGRDGAPGWLAWDVRAAEERRHGNEFAAFPAALADLVGTSPDGVPRLDARGHIEARVLELTDGQRTVAEIVGMLVDEGWVEQEQAEWVVANALLGRIEVDRAPAFRSDGVTP